MITLTDNSIIIEIEHPDPKEGIHYLQKSLIYALKLQAQAPIEFLNKQDKELSCDLLEFLQSTLLVETNKE